MIYTKVSTYTPPYTVNKKKFLSFQKGSHDLAKPNSAVVYVAKEYPPWQKTVLVTLRKLYEANNHAFPDNKEVMAIFKDEELIKKHMKKLMPFVAYVKVNLSLYCLLLNFSLLQIFILFNVGLQERVLKEGISAMDLNVPFDETAVLSENLAYLLKSIEVISLEFLLKLLA